MTPRFLWSAAAILLVASCTGCASKPAYSPKECPIWEGLAPIQVNPAGALDRHLRVQAAFRVCPPVEGIAEIERKWIELRHETISLLSSQTTAQLEDPLRAEKLREQLLILANDKVLKKARVTEVFITGMHLD
ncbi:MAG: flagellar basal body-associated FliL family protein [bacterium]|nr:flagellar basal body-associated FliL family protein [bacterium]